MICLYCNSILKSAGTLNYQYYWCYKHKPKILDIEYSVFEGNIRSVMITSRSECIYIKKHDGKCFVDYNTNGIILSFILDRNFYLKQLDEIIEQIKTLTLFS